MPYTSGIGFRSWHADHPSFKRLGAGTPSRFALVFTSAIERVPKQNRPILSRACPRVSERILAKKRVSEFPNILSGTSFHNCNGAALLYPDQNGSFYGENASDHYQKVVETGEGKSFSVLKMDASRSSAVYGAANTVQPNSLRALVLVRAY